MPLISNRKLLPAIFVVIFSWNQLLAQPDTVLIFHPTVSNIKTFSFLFEHLIESKYKDGFHLLGVYHSKEGYDYNQSKYYIEEGNTDISWSLYEISEEVDPNRLFGKNAFTEDFSELFRSSVGAIFTGGPDLPPQIYNEKQNLLTVVSDPYRHFMEVSAISHFLGGSKITDNLLPFLSYDNKYVILGICLGMQTMNVGTGGTLIQDIPTELYNQVYREDVMSNSTIAHRNYHWDNPLDSISLTSYYFHQVQLDISLLNKKILTQKSNSQPFVLSSHHQSIKDIGEGLVPAGWSMDGKVIEAVVHKEYPNVIGIQFHPEKTSIFSGDPDYYKDSDSVVNFKIFAERNNSLDFHKNLWEILGDLFND